MHSTFCNLLFPTSHFLIFSQKEDEERKRQEEEDQRNAAGHGSSGGGRGKAKVRAASKFHNQSGLNSVALGHGRACGQRLRVYTVLNWRASLEGQGISPL